jgi:hypothetical protein
MTTEIAPGQARALPGGSAGTGAARRGFLDRMARYWIWVAVIGHMVLRDRRFQASVITGAIGAYALGSVGKNNEARPLRRATAWYNVHGQVHDIEVIHGGRRALKPGKP